MRVNRGSRRVGSGLTKEVRAIHKQNKGHLYRISRIDKTFDNFPWQNVIFCVNLRKMRRVRIFVVGLAISILALVKGEHGFSCLQKNIELTSEEG